MDPHLVAYAERQAPRYTSYPSANHFSADVDARRYESWLGELAPDSNLSLYVHVPYCRQLCWYCGCNTFLTRGSDIPSFVSTLMTEIDLVGSRIGSHRVNELHWGGGTPNVLSAEEFIRLKHHIDFWFDVAPGAAHAVELDPRHVTPELAETYSAAGVTRVSLGVQDLNPHVQAAIGRVQPLKQVREAVRMLRWAGIGDVSFDLMYGLPGQSRVDLVRTIRLACELEPQRISLFGYAHVPWFKRRQRLIDATALPGAEERFEQADVAHFMLGELGYESIGLDHFARPGDALAVAARTGTLQRNFQGYALATSAALIGLGPSAISQLPQGYAQNASGVGAWRRALNGGRAPTARGHAQSAEDKRRAAIIQAIMCSMEVDLSPWGGWAAFPNALEDLRELEAAGIAEIDGQTVRTPPDMRHFCRLVAKAFDAYAAPSAPAHARAV